MMRILSLLLLLTPVLIRAQHPGYVQEPPSEGWTHTQVRVFPASKTTLASADTIGLPFFESFTTRDGLGFDTTNWLPASLLQTQPHLSRTTAINPPDIGTFLFDGTDSFGRVYEQLVPYGRADSLISKCIDLSSFEPKDSLYLSFYYQPGGLGDKPEVSDSLFLEFRIDPDTLPTITYAPAWSIAADTLTDVFRRVEVPIIDSLFFHSCFQMKFGSVGSLNGRFDLWHLDYIRLEANRSAGDSLWNDMAIVAIDGILYDSTFALPYDNYIGGGQPPLQPLTLRLFNRSANPQFRQVTVSLVDTTNGAVIDTWNTGATFPPGPRSLTIPAFELPASLSPTALKVLAELSPNDLAPLNDSASVDFPLHAYYAYSDEEGEIGYGLFAQNRGFAQDFHIEGTDTLKALWVNWFPNSGSVFGTSFRTAVWTDLSDSPESISYQSFGSKFFPEAMHNWVRYRMADSALVSSSFRVGFLQTTDDPLGVGMDLNHPGTTNLWYDFEGQWLPDNDALGNLSLRLEFANNNSPITGRLPESVRVSVYPELRVFGNPVNGERLNFAVVNGGSGLVQFHLLDMNGKVMYYAKNEAGQTHSLPVVDLPEGVYYLNVLTPNRNASSASLLSHKIIVE